MPALLNLSEAELEKLRYERYAYPCPLIQKRLFAVYLRAVTDYPYRQIGFICGLHENTVAHWVRIYEQHDYEALLVNHYGTNQSALEQHRQSLLCSFHQEPPRTASEAGERIREMTGVERSPQQVRCFMKRHGLKFLKCGHVPAKADNEKQHHWVEETLAPAIKAAQEGKTHLFFYGCRAFCSRSVCVLFVVCGPAVH